jgi:hypothetical protein
MKNTFSDCVKFMKKRITGVFGIHHVNYINPAIDDGQLQIIHYQPFMVIEG